MLPCDEILFENCFENWSQVRIQSRSEKYLSEKTGFLKNDAAAAVIDLSMSQLEGKFRTILVIKSLIVVGSFFK